MGALAELVLEGLAAGALEGLAAAGFYICFFGRRKGSILTGTGIAVLSFAFFLMPSLQLAVPLLSAAWMMAAGRMFQTVQWKELFLAGGMWLMGRSLACLWPDSTPLQIVFVLALFGMVALYLLCQERLYPLWMGTLVCLWLLGGFLGGIVYEEAWQERVMKVVCYLVLGGIFVFQQVFCIREEMRRRTWEETGAQGKGQEESRSGQRNDREFGKKRKGTLGGGDKDWQEAADREVRRLRIFEHDFRHHLDMLGALYEEGNPAEARAYLEDLKQARLSGQGRKNGGERELSYIVMAKKEACRKAGISFSCQILGSPQGIAQMDMTALLLNLLDNAIRACEKVPEPRSIGMMLLARGDLWQIELVNTGQYEPQEAEQERVGQLHGIGLISVRQIVEKYQGVFETRQEGNTVVQKLILIGQFPE